MSQSCSACVNVRLHTDAIELVQLSCAPHLVIDKELIKNKGSRLLVGRNSIGKSIEKRKLYNKCPSTQMAAIELTATVSSVTSGLGRPDPTQIPGAAGRSSAADTPASSGKGPANGSRPPGAPSNGSDASAAAGVPPASNGARPSGSGNGAAVWHQQQQQQSWQLPGRQPPPTASGNGGAGGIGGAFSWPPPLAGPEPRSGGGGLFGSSNGSVGAPQQSPPHSSQPPPHPPMEWAGTFGRGGTAWMDEHPRYHLESMDSGDMDSGGSPPEPRRRQQRRQGPSGGSGSGGSSMLGSYSWWRPPFG